MKVHQPVKTIRAIVAQAIEDNRAANGARPLGSDPITLTTTDVVDEYGLDDGDYVRPDEDASHPVANQLVRGELLAAYRRHDVHRLRRPDGTPSRRDHEYEYVAISGPATIVA